MVSKGYEYQKQWRLENTERRKEWVRQRRVQLQSYKDVPCADCKGTFPPECMDFDHRDPAEKYMNVASMVNLRLDLIEAEIAKCDIVCSNCHRIRTNQRRLGQNGTG